MEKNPHAAGINELILSSYFVSLDKKKASHDILRASIFKPFSTGILVVHVRIPKIIFFTFIFR